MDSSRAFWGAVLSVALVVGAMHGSASLPAWASNDDPSWADVEAARDDAASTSRQLALIDDALTGLEARSAALGDAAVEASALVESTRTDLDDAVTRAASIGEQRDVAEAEVESASAQLGRIAAATYRSGTGGLAVRILLDKDSDEDLLYQLTVSAQLGSAAQELRERATAQSNLMQTLDEQAAEVARERDRLATLAKEQADGATSAQRAADEQLAQQEHRSDALFAQLAVLKDTSADLERGYRARIAAEAAYKKQQDRAAADAQKPAPGDSSAGSDPGPTPSKPTPRAAPELTPTPTPAPTPTQTPAPPVDIVVDPAAAQTYAARVVTARGWGVSEYTCLLWLWNRESSWRADAYNPYSGAYGIPQALPGHKMASAGADWRTNAATQINWGLGYITDRYGTPCGAWAHSEAYNWY